MSEDSLRAWYRDSIEEHPEELHQTDPPEFLTQEEVFVKTGVTYWREEKYNDEERLKELKEEGGYKSSDFLEIRGEVGTENMERMSYKEHLHEDSEIRMVTAGSIFFEVRSCDGRWIRLHLREGDLINLPPGIYHRGALDKGDYCKLYRLFLDISEWKAFYPPEADTLPVRIQYQKEMGFLAS
ncbi:hypothetical protein BaRGS_00018344 [Batillaria attramentaria]|uniref:acireductone dioxygenase (Fe(2+)-requiring) n=1 Tax=Batillaria attramentaria TaxID=370345 RepID=A0ABD0KT69_9CAEN